MPVAACVKQTEGRSAGRGKCGFWVPAFLRVLRGACVGVCVVWAQRFLASAVEWLWWRPAGPSGAPWGGGGGGGGREAVEWLWCSVPPGPRGAVGGVGGGRGGAAAQWMMALVGPQGPATRRGGRGRRGGVGAGGRSGIGSGGVPQGPARRRGGRGAGAAGGCGAPAGREKQSPPARLARSPLAAAWPRAAAASSRGGSCARCDCAAALDHRCAGGALGAREARGMPTAVLSALHPRDAAAEPIVLTMSLPQSTWELHYLNNLLKEVSFLSTPFRGSLYDILLIQDTSQIVTVLHLLGMIVVYL
ncbi:Protein of unknown function [Gryllus bimaculatus]|nr:Protein of unknown function [Gryllus bimaculatus]